MIGISCKEELITERYDLLRKNMSPDSHITIFPVDDWMEPWGFERENKNIANKLYNEFMLIQDYDEVDSISDAMSGEIIIALKSQNEIGIVYIAEDQSMLREYLEDLINYLMIQNSTRPVTKLGNVPEPKKPDNLVIPRLNLFK